jgi:hypothetical protein
MSAFSTEFTTSDVVGLVPGWDRLIAADLVQEMEHDISEKVETIPQMRLFLAIKGYKQLREFLIDESRGKFGAAALKAMALASRRYAKDRPGLSAATFRTPMVESKEWMEASIALRQLFAKAFSEYGLDESAGAHALRMLRSLVRGFVVNEMSGSFYASADSDESFELAVEVFICGLPALTRTCRHCEAIVPHRSGLGSVPRDHTSTAKN